MSDRGTATAAIDASDQRAHVFRAARRHAQARNVDEEIFAARPDLRRNATGVELSDAERLGVLDDLYPRTPTLPPVRVRPFVFALPARRPLVETVEVERAFWVPLARIVEPSVRRDVKLLVGGVERVFPAYDLGDDVIWGMTERILTPFLELLGYSH